MGEFQPPIAFYYLKIIPKATWTKLFYLIIMLVAAGITFLVLQYFVFPNLTTGALEAI